MCLNPKSSEREKVIDFKKDQLNSIKNWPLSNIIIMIKEKESK